MSDSAYLDAVRRGDMKTAQRMVDAAANAAGYGTEKLYHGNETGPFKSIERPLFLSASRNEAKAYSEETDIEAFTKQTLIPMEKSEVQFPSRMDMMKSWPIVSDFVGKPFTPQATADGELFYWDGTTNAYGDNNIVFISNRVVDDSGKVVPGKPSVQESVGPSVTPFIGTYYVGGKLLPVRDSRFAEPGQPSAVNVIATRLGGDRGLTEKWSMLLKRGGYSGIDTFSDDGLERGVRVRNVVMFDPTQIKSADPVTYDDAGQVIPLSQRFNSESPDIRNPKLKRGLSKRKRTMRNPATVDDFPPAQGAVARSPQIDTPAFKKWFDGSVVVTRDGKPRIMYHGTGWTNLSEFRSHRSQGEIAGFFAFDPKFAEDFALVYEPGTSEYESEEEDDQGIKKAASVYPVYLSLKKVFDVRKKEDRDEIRFDDLMKLKGQKESRNGWEWHQLESIGVVGRMKRAGYDGYIDFEKGSKVEATGIAVFDTRNVKSAYGNRGTFDPADPDIRNPYTRPDLRERLKRKIMAGDKGGRPGQWSARKAQLLAAEYEKAGGGYSGKRTASQRSLSRWTKQDWRTKSGKPSLETGERYLPAAAITALTSAEYAETSRAKRKAIGQFSRQPKRIAEKTSRYRKNPDETNHPMTSRVHYRLNPDSKGKGASAVRSKLSQIIEPGDRILCYDTAKGEDFYRLWDIIHTALPLTHEALTEIEGMLDDDGVLVIESGETPEGLQDHFRKATRYNGLLLVQGPKDPEGARIKTEELRRELE